MNVRLAIGVVVGLVAAQFFAERGAAQEKPSKKIELKTVDDKAAYAIGANSARSIRRASEGHALGLDPEIILRGFREAILGSGKLSMADEDMDEAVQALQDQVAARNAKAGDAYMAANKTKAGVKTLPSGLQVKVLKKGAGGKKPTINDNVVVHYRGKLTDGKEFESSNPQDGPVTMPVAQMLPGWSEALQLMEVGSKWEVAIPPDLAFGPQSNEKFGPNSTLIYEIELVDIAKPNPVQRPSAIPIPKGRPSKPAETEN